MNSQARVHGTRGRRRRWHDRFHRRSDSFRLERSNLAGWDLHPLGLCALSRRTIICEIILNFIFYGDFRLFGSPPWFILIGHPLLLMSLIESWSFWLRVVVVFVA